MKDWNVVATSQMGQERRLLRELADLGEFQGSGFREVLIGRVPDPDACLETLKERWDSQAFLPEILSTVVPIRRVFSFSLENLLERLNEAVLAFLPHIEGKAFYVRVKRRGHKGEIKSQEVEQALDRYILDTLAARGAAAQVDFQNPGAILAVEILHNQCGLTLITRDMKERYPFIKIK